MICRPGYQNPWPDAAVCRLEPLAGEDGVELAQELLSGARLPHDLALMLVERTGGNPFFMEETLAGLERTGALARKDGEWRLAPAASKTSLTPVTVQEGLTARVGQLPLPERQVIQAASVIGISFPPALLRQIPSCDPLPALHRLIELRLVRSERRDWSFRHAVTRDTVYGSLTTERKRTRRR